MVSREGAVPRREAEGQRPPNEALRRHRDCCLVYIRNRSLGGGGAAVIREFLGLVSKSRCPECDAEVSRRPDGWYVCSRENAPSHQWRYSRDLNGDSAPWHGLGVAFAFLVILPVRLFASKLKTRDRP